MKVGIGYCNQDDGFRSGKTVAEQAVQAAGIDRPDLVVAFCSGSVDHDAFFKGMQSCLGAEVPVIGGSAVGVITNDVLCYEGYPAAAAAIQSDRFGCRIATAGGLDRDERQAGALLAETLGHQPDDRFLLIFYDSVKIPPRQAPPVMNASPPLIGGIESRVKPSIPIIGAGVVCDYDFNPTIQFCGSCVSTQSLVGAMFSGGITAYSDIMHGCTLKDGIYHTITKIKGPVIYELDGRPIVPLIDEIYGSREWRNQIPVKRLSIGVNYGKRYGEFNEADYVIRLISGALPGGEGIVLFEPDLDEGTDIVFMLRDADKMIFSAKESTARLVQKVVAAGKTPRLGMYIDCAGRTASFSDTLTEEAEAVQKILTRHKIPLLGFYSGVEIAPLLGKSRGLDWTGVLMILTED